SRFTPGDDRWVDVCALCTDTANEHGWLKEGTPTTPLIAESPRRRNRFPGLGLLERRRVEPEPVVSEPVLRRLSPEEHALVEAAELYNDSAYSRTIAGIAKSLGSARVSMLPLSGTNTEIVITIVWDISWYQYRVLFDSSQPVRLAERGHEVAELGERFKSWNAHLDEHGRLSPDIPKL
ncbi:MAG: hypothetical protein M3377_03135, partial [Actinomycetota bacterium]|nr:hypothetical protein [Actinomycetota bacterium]